MSDSHCIVAVDVGNSAAKVGLRCDSGALSQSAFPIEESDWIEQAIAWVESKRPGNQSRSLEWRIASVKQSASEQLVERLNQARLTNNVDINIRVIGHKDIPIESSVDRREQVGIDRLIAAFAAKSFFGCPVTIVDAGSAVTVDWVDEKSNYRGGAILPGINLQLQSLARDTDALPEVVVEDMENVKIPATNTHDAIRLGVVTGIASAIDRISANYATLSQHSVGREDSKSPQKNRETPNTSAPTVVLTGGDAVTVARFLTCPHQRRPDLVCRGILDLPPE